MVTREEASGSPDFAGEQTGLLVVVVVAMVVGAGVGTVVCSSGRSKRSSSGSFKGKRRRRGGLLRIRLLGVGVVGIVLVFSWFLQAT